MTINRATKMQETLLAWAIVALAVGPLAACKGEPKASTDAATSTAGGGDKLPAKAGDPAATDEALRTSGIVTSRKACELLTRPDSEAAVGQPLPESTVNITLGMCDYHTADFSAAASVTVGSWESIRNAATSGSHHPEAISGIGDEALNLNGSNGSNLYVRKGSEGFLLTLNGPTIDHLPDHGLAREKELALKILGRF